MESNRNAVLVAIHYKTALFDAHDMHLDICAILYLACMVTITGFVFSSHGNLISRRLVLHVE